MVNIKLDGYTITSDASNWILSEITSSGKVGYMHYYPTLVSLLSGYKEYKLKAVDANSFADLGRAVQSIKEELKGIESQLGIKVKA